MDSNTPKPKRRYTVTGYERGDQEDDVAYKARLDRQIRPGPPTSIASGSAPALRLWIREPSSRSLP